MRQKEFHKDEALEQPPPMGTRYLRRDTTEALKRRRDKLWKALATCDASEAMRLHGRIWEIDAELRNRSG